MQLLLSDFMLFFVTLGKHARPLPAVSMGITIFCFAEVPSLQQTSQGYATASIDASAII